MRSFAAMSSENPTQRGRMHVSQLRQRPGFTSRIRSYVDCYLNKQSPVCLLYSSLFKNDFYAESKNIGGELELDPSTRLDLMIWILFTKSRKHQPVTIILEKCVSRVALELGF